MFAFCSADGRRPGRVAATSKTGSRTGHRGWLGPLSSNIFRARVMRRTVCPAGLFWVCALVLACGGGEANSGTAGSDAGGNTSADHLEYCDVEPIVAAKCERCHHEPPENGAPFSLASYADLQGPGENPRVGKIRHALETDFMPPTWLEVDPPVQPLTCEEKLTLLDWLESGSPPSADSDHCSEREPTLRSCD